MSCWLNEGKWHSTSGSSISYQYSPSASEYRLIFSECHMARGAHGWPSLHICRAAGDRGKYRRGQPCAPRAISRAKYQPIFTNARWILYLKVTWKVRNESFLWTSVLCERLKLQCLYSSPLRPNWLDRSFSSCIRQLADSSGGKSEDSWASGPGSSSLCGEVFVTSLSFFF